MSITISLRDDEVFLVYNILYNSGSAYAGELAEIIRKKAKKESPLKFRDL